MCLNVSKDFSKQTSTHISFKQLTCPLTTNFLYIPTAEAGEEMSKSMMYPLPACVILSSVKLNQPFSETMVAVPSRTASTWPVPDLMVAVISHGLSAIPRCSISSP